MVQSETPRRAALVTGGARGIGRAACLALAAEGRDIAVNYAGSAAAAEQTAADCRALGVQAVALQADVRRPEACKQLVEDAAAAFGRLDVLVNNAGIMDDNTAVGDVSDEMIERLFRVNTYGPLYAMRKAVQVFLTQGEDGGNIINITSVGAAHQTAGVAYCASKAAIASATKNTAFMYIDKGIRCNAIAPGGILTDIALVMPKANKFGFERTGSLLAHSPEMGLPEDIAGAALFLASDESHFVNGTTVVCDGGWTCF